MKAIRRRTVKTVLFTIAFATVLSFAPFVFAAEHSFQQPVGEKQLIGKATCNFTSGSGLLDIREGKIGQVFTASGATCGPALLANYMVALVQFFFRLAIVLAVVMVMIGGFQWLLALGNPGRIGTAKETIQMAVTGLILALTATLLFSQIDKNFVELKSLSIPNEPLATDKLGSSSCISQTAEFYINSESLSAADAAARAEAGCLGITNSDGVRSCEWVDNKCKQLVLDTCTFPDNYCDSINSCADYTQAACALSCDPCNYSNNNETCVWKPPGACKTCVDEEYCIDNDCSYVQVCE